VSLDAGTLKKAKTMLKGTLRGLGNATLRRLKGGTMKKVGVVSDAELVKIKANIVDCWKRLVVSIRHCCVTFTGYYR